MGGGFRFAGASTMTLEKINFRQQRWDARGVVG